MPLPFLFRSASLYPGSPSIFKSSSLLCRRSYVPNVLSRVPPSITLTARAAQQIAAINDADRTTHQCLRLSVESGGCHGFQYRFELTNITTKEPDDIDVAVESSHLLVDSTSIDFVKGATIDYVEELIGSSFKVADNPNVDNGCGCGVSFDVKG